MISSFEQKESILYKTTFSEIEEVLEVSLDTIKKWALHFDIKSEKDENGYRYYSDETIKFFEKIKSFVAQGYPLEDIESFLKLNENEKNSSVKNQKGKVENKTEQTMTATPFMNQPKNFQSANCDLSMAKKRLIGKTAIEHSKLMAKIEILEFQKNELESNKNTMMSFFESQLNEYKNLLITKDKAIYQLEKHLTDYAKLKQNTKWWHF